MCNQEQILLCRVTRSKSYRQDFHIPPVEDWGLVRHSPCPFHLPPGRHQRGRVSTCAFARWAVCRGRRRVSFVIKPVYSTSSAHGSLEQEQSGHGESISRTAHHVSLIFKSPTAQSLVHTAGEWTLGKWKGSDPVGGFLF